MPVIGIPDESGKNLVGWMQCSQSYRCHLESGSNRSDQRCKNAAILAAKILATSDEELLEKLKAYTAEMKESVEAKAEKLDLRI